MNTSVLFLIFNRPECTQSTFEQIRKAKPKKLYISADGPRLNNHSDFQNCRTVLEIVSKVDWQCEVKTLFRKENLGCKLAVSEGISWFFENEEEGIIIEDDCFPSLDFFWFCESMLKYYRYEYKVSSIVGTNFLDGRKFGPASYYISKYADIWGWATWRRAWSKYDVTINYWNDYKKTDKWKRLHKTKSERLYWEKCFDSVNDGKCNTWDYQWVLTNFYYSSLTIVPNYNLIQNIGFGNSATHCSQSVCIKNLHKLKIEKIKEINYTHCLDINHRADELYFRRVHNYSFFENFLRLYNRLFNIISSKNFNFSRQ